ncbi:MAG TPA: cytochrome c biogenesis protein CcsA [Membranihabitans sp.]|nr:cytochrome c biogenesis protein CcsA [Membranihabitans sp.]
MKWWKILAIVILLYVHIAGLLIPIGTGITRVDPYQIKAGEEVSMTINTYNVVLDQTSPDQIRTWLKFDDTHLIAGQDNSITSENEIVTTFRLPVSLPDGKKNGDLTLIMDVPGQGTPVLPRAAFVSVGETPGSSAYQWENIDLTNLNVVSKMHFPYRSILQETIRNTYFHVSLWLAMMILLTGAVVFSILNLRNGSLLNDSRAYALTEVGFFFGILGLTTGMIWAQYTWGKAWSWDIKQLTTAIALLIYAAYFLLRNSIKDPHQKAKLGAVYNIFSYVALIPLLYIIPRMSESLHPGSGGNPALGGEDLDSTMRMIFYPAVIGWALVGLWMSELISRFRQLRIITNKS